MAGCTRSCAALGCCPKARGPRGGSSISTKIRTLIRQQWAGLIALFLVLIGGTALATHAGGAWVEADTLDGIDSSGFIHGSGNVSGRASVKIHGERSQVTGAIPGFPFTLFYKCPSDPASTNGGWVFRNDSGGAADLFADNGGGDPSFAALKAGATHDEATQFSGEYIVFQVQWPPDRFPDDRIATVMAFSRHFDMFCHVQVQILSNDDVEG